MIKKKIIYFGTPIFSVCFLRSLNESGLFDIVTVISEPDRQTGRGRKVTPTPIKQYCLDNNLICVQPEKVATLKDRLIDLKPDIGIVVAYGQIIPDSIINIPSFGTVNVHPSDLPKYRGPAPIQSALINGDRKTAISIMKIDSKMDHGPILDKKELEISVDDNYDMLEKKILNIAPRLLIHSLNQYLNKQIHPVNQNHEFASYTKMLKKVDGLIDWNKSAMEIHNQVRAYSNWPRAYTFIENKRLIFLKTKIIAGKLYPILVQLEGKKPASWKNFITGRKNPLPKQLTDKIS